MTTKCCVLQSRLYPLMQLLSHLPLWDPTTLPLLFSCSLVSSICSCTSTKFFCFFFPTFLLPPLMVLFARFIFYSWISVLSFLFSKMVFTEPYCETAAFFSASQLSIALASLLGGYPDSPFWVSIVIHIRVLRGKYIDFLWNVSYLYVKRRAQ